MPKQFARQNRRREPRYCCNQSLISWRREPRRQRRPGWLYDRSMSGLAFGALVDGKPRVGDEVEVVTRRNVRPIMFRVVRVMPTSDDEVLVGCRRMAAAETPALRHPSSIGPAAESAVRPPKPRRAPARFAA